MGDRLLAIGRHFRNFLPIAYCPLPIALSLKEGYARVSHGGVKLIGNASVVA